MNEAVLAPETTGILAGKWILASEALVLVKASTNSRKKAEGLIFDYLQDGKVKARCSLLIREIDFGKVKKTPPALGGARQTTEISRAESTLAQGLWQVKHRSRYNDTLFLWDHNVCAVVQSKAQLSRRRGKSFITPGIRHVGYGVEFAVEDIYQLIENTFPGRYYLLPKEHAAGSVKPQNDKWSKVAHLYQLALAGKLGDALGPPDVRGFQADIIKDIREQYKEDEGSHWPSAKTVKRYAKHLQELNDTARKRPHS